MAKQPTQVDHEQARLETERPKCGLIMPIASFGDYPQSHWTSVESIFVEALDESGFDAKLVSQETTSGVIHQRIISNLYTREIIVCDVSARNPNVMFELGMRLAFDKPTVIVKDDETPFSFDTSPIEHLTYPRSLKYSEIVSFKKKLGDVVQSTNEEALKNPEYSTFLKHISGVKPAKLNVKEIPYEDFILKQLEELHAKIDSIPQNAPKDPDFEPLRRPSGGVARIQFKIDTSFLDSKEILEIMNELKEFENAKNISHAKYKDDSFISFRMINRKYNTDKVKSILNKLSIDPQAFSEL